MPEWTLEEKMILRKLMEPFSPARTVLDKFFNEQASEMNDRCSHCMANVPREPELASDYAAKAQVYSRLIGELERFALRS